MSQKQNVSIQKTKSVNSLSSAVINNTSVYQGRPIAENNNKKEDDDLMGYLD